MMAEPTIGLNLRLPIEIHTALHKMAPARGANKFVIDLIRAEAIRRGELPAEAGKKRKGAR